MNWRPSRGENKKPDTAAYSVRRRLLIAVLGASLVMWLVSLAVVVHVAWRETSDVFDDSLKEGARLALVLGASLQAQGALAGQDPVTQPEAAKVKLYYQIVDSEGRVLRRARDAPKQAFTTDTQADHDYRNAWADGQAWRIYLLRADGLNFQVQIGQPWDERTGLLDDMAEELVWPALVMLAVLALFCWVMITRLLRPIEHTARRIATKSPDDLQPMPLDHEPRELQPIVLAFNSVLGRLDDALQTERRFTADAAHELRTPLAALRMRIQLMQRQQAGDGASALIAPLQILRDDVDRCTRLVESLLTLARLDPQTEDRLETEVVDVAALFTRLSHGQAVSNDPSLSFHAGAPTVTAHPALLESALRNLIDNARRYGGPGSKVRVEAHPPTQESGAVITVKDNGPGVSADDRARLTERFFRVLGTGENGSGLGLSIVARIAALHGASLRFGPGLDGHGLGVTLEFPAT